MTTALIHPTAWIDRFFDDFDRGYPAARSNFAPAVDVVQDRDAYVLRAELPGVTKDNINVEVKENRLVLSGRKESTTQGEEGKYRYVESRYGQFVRTFELPRNVKSDAIEAQYKDGVLNLRIPKAEESKPKAVEIK
ncbi:MAG TPA: hypothetical protein DCQ83_05770 [Fibrobacteres bacterium]|jgi:HSP20 family protein|nr:hypothetical protein [Fibrobacterota bacterium]